MLKVEAQRFRTANGYFDKSNDAKQRELEQEVRNFKKDYIKIRDEQDVCVTCGVLVNAKTIDEAGHTNGKQHRAFVRLREYLPKLREYVRIQHERAEGGRRESRGGRDSYADDRKDRRSRSRSRGRR